MKTKLVKSIKNVMLGACALVIVGQTVAYAGSGTVGCGRLVGTEFGKVNAVDAQMDNKFYYQTDYTCQNRQATGKSAVTVNGYKTWSKSSSGLETVRTTQTTTTAASSHSHSYTDYLTSR